MPKGLNEDFFERLAARAEPAVRKRAKTSPRLKAKVYSALMRRAAQGGPLRSLPATKAAGRRLCVFEEAVRLAPVGERLKALNLCRVCHARLLAESFNHPPIFWRECPYVGFKKTW